MERAGKGRTAAEAREQQQQTTIVSRRSASASACVRGRRTCGCVLCSSPPPPPARRWTTLTLPTLPVRFPCPFVRCSGRPCVCTDAANDAGAAAAGALIVRMRLGEWMSEWEAGRRAAVADGQTDRQRQGSAARLAAFVFSLCCGFLSNPCQCTLRRSNPTSSSKHISNTMKPGSSKNNMLSHPQSDSSSGWFGGEDEDRCMAVV